MATNPVFPFYYNDFDRSTRDWTDEEVGAYVRLLVHQWDKGSLPKSYQRLTKLATSLDTTWDVIKHKFEETEHGYQNRRLELIRERLLKHKEKQKDNVRKRYQTSTKPPTKNLPLENENENIIEILERIKNLTDQSEKQIDEKFFVMLILRMIEVFKTNFPKYPVNKEIDYSACLQIAYGIAEQKGWMKHDVVNGRMEDCVDSWKTIVEFIKTDSWLATRSLSDISSPKEWQRLIQKMRKPKKPESTETNSAPTLTRLQ